MTHNAAMAHMSPYLSMAHINPWMSNPQFFGLNPMYSQFLAWNYMMNPTTMMMNGMWNPHSMMAGYFHPLSNPFVHHST